MGVFFKGRYSETPSQYLDLQFGTFTKSGAGLPTPVFFYGFGPAVFSSHLIMWILKACILCGPYFFELMQ